MDISNEQIEKVLYNFLCDKTREDPSFIRRLLEDIEDDAACLHLAEQTDAENNPTVSASDIFSKLKG